MTQSITFPVVAALKEFLEKPCIFFQVNVIKIAVGEKHYKLYGRL